MTSAVIVTGAAGGIGAALCARVRADGYIAIGVDRREAPVADVIVPLDLADTAMVASVACELSSEYQLQAVIHNAAVQPLGSVGHIGAADWLDAFRVNVLAVDALVASVRENLARNKGSVVAVSSVHARATTGGITAYAASKTALEGWVRSAALDLGPAIRVNAVAPGAIDTPKLREGFARWGQESAEERKALLCERTALRRIGEPSDVAGAVSFLMSSDAAFITGTTLVVDGGATARLGSE